MLNRQLMLVSHRFKPFLAVVLLDLIIPMIRVLQVGLRDLTLVFVGGR
jgi:hypothetical protein